MIDRKDVCSHKVLPRDCALCATEALLIGAKKTNLPIEKNIKQHVLYPAIKNGIGNVYIYDVFYNDNLEGLYPQSFENSNDVSNPIKLRIVFVGPKEAYFGFIACLSTKYCHRSIINNGLAYCLGGEMDAELQDRHFWGGDYEGCPYPDKRPVSYIQHDDGEGWDVSYRSPNIDEFIAGFKMMLELDIGGLEMRDFVYDTSYVVLDETHSDQCEGEHPMTPIDAYETKTKCKAYWYRIE